MRKVFLDANVVLDFLDAERRYHEHSKKVMEILINEDAVIVISEDILTTVYYVVKDKKAVLNFFEYILHNWEIAAFGRNVIENAVKLCNADMELDFEDVSQSLCAGEAGCMVLITNDKNFFKDGVPVLSAEKYIRDKLMK